MSAPRKDYLDISMSIQKYAPEFLRSGCLLTPSQENFILGWGDILRTDRPVVGKLSIYAPDFFLKDARPWWVYSNQLTVSRSELSRSLRVFLADSKDFFSELKWELPKFENFEAAFLDLQSLFKAGTLKKAVPVIFERAKFEIGIAEKAALLTSLIDRTANLPLNPYGVWNQPGPEGSGEGILGATPELLFQKDSHGFSTVALAGTRLKGSPHPPILQDPKELSEHQWVIDGICSSLTPLGSVRVGKTEEMELPTFSHLITPIRFETEADFEKIVQCLHPTPALGAFPKAEGLRWLESYSQGLDRWRFGAPFGAIDRSGQTQCWVAIRNLMWKEAGLSLGAGCGVIPASELNREWKELQAKIQSVKSWFISDAKK